MTVEFRCPHCERLLKTSEDRAGQEAKCPGCGEALVVPSVSEGEEDVPVSEGWAADYEPAAGGTTAAPAGASTREAATGPPPLPGRGEGMVCPMCGAQNDPGLAHCHFCGESLQDESTAAGGGKWTPTPIDAGRVFSDAWETYKANMGPCIGAIVIIGLINFLISLPANILNTGLENGWFGRDVRVFVIMLLAGLNIVGIVVQLFLTAGQHIFLLKIVRGESAEINDLFAGGPYLLRMIGNSLIFGILVFVGFLACVIPGFIVMLMFWPFMYVLVDRNARGLEPLNLAKDITSGNWGHTFLLGLGAFGIQLLGLMACFIGLIFTTPLSLLLFTTAYVHMIGGQPASARRVEDAAI